jgi:hypothetical protein
MLKDYLGTNSTSGVCYDEDYMVAHQWISYEERTGWPAWPPHREEICQCNELATRRE